MGFEVSGFEVNASILGTGGMLAWTRTAGDEGVARAVITFLEDRRILFGDPLRPQRVGDPRLPHGTDNASEIREVSGGIASGHASGLPPVR
jgi:hypothetical protein